MVAFNSGCGPSAASTARLMSGTEGAAFPFWSPDSRTVGFFADGKLKKMQTNGCDAARAL